MALADSMFLFEIVIKDLWSYTHYKKMKIIGQFADVFKVYLKSPTPYSKKTGTKNVKQADKVKKNNLKDRTSESKIRTHMGQLILIVNKTSNLVSLMKKYPLEILISKDPEQYLGSTIIPWSNEYLNYLTKDHLKSAFPPAYTEREYNVFDELTTRRIFTINMSLKLTYLKDKTISQIRSISNKNCSLIDLNKYKMMYNESLIDASTKSLISVSSKEMYTSDNAKEISNERILLKSESIVQEVGCIESDIDISKEHKNTAVSGKSCSSIDYRQNNLFRYIFGDPMGSFGNKVYQVGYFTVETDVAGKNSPKVVSGDQSPEKSTESKKKLGFKKCDSECLNKEFGSCEDNVLDLPVEASHLINVTKCKELTCNYKKHRELPPSPDDRILLDVGQKIDCCSKVMETVEEVVGGVITKMKIGHDPCFCTCECGLVSIRKTTYCTICGGYEIAGDDGIRKTAFEDAMPCPIFHKLVDKNKLKTWSTSGSDSRKKGDDQRSTSIRSSQRTITDRRPTVIEKKSIESEKSRKKKKDDRFKFNYGYKAPQIGHSKCALPCTGTLDNVPKRMGWLWSSENVPGLKYRPMWKPGAINKHVLRLLRMARHPGQIISKKKRKDLGKKKRPLKRPLLMVHKKDGEYTVTMETMKSFSKPRALNQNPYEDKPVVTFTVGRTEEENRERLKRKEREQRRLERAQRNFIQSAFRDMCHEICLKTYQQALGILPDAEDLPCTCYPAIPSAKDTNMDLSCSCSEDKSSTIGSDTDSDEWLVEFTPPNATFDPFHKGKKVLKEDNGSQYTYLDYKVKLFDRFGNPIPRFFKGPDGKQECSDLGGFWSPDHKWLEINIDGYIAPDGKWAPINFIGPSGEQVEADTGKFQAMNGKWLVVGVDGYVDSKGKWKFYPKAMESMKKRYGGAARRKGKPRDKIEKTPLKSEGSWSCFGDVSPRHLSELGIIGHGEDRKLLLIKLQKMLERGEDVRIPQPSTVYRLPRSKTGKKGVSRMKFYRSFQKSYECHHPVPSDKGIVAVNDHGNKIYFRLKDHKNRRPIERIAKLTEQGISLSSFHVPCFHSFINAEVMKQQQRERLLALSNKNVVSRGWKPGAISNRLLRMLDKAKSNKSTAERVEHIKRTKKQVEEKPTLIVCKRNGHYHVELQASADKQKELNEQYTPLIYKIETLNNKAKIKKKEKIQRRLTRAALNGAWSDPVYPEACENVCLPAYKQAVGILPESGDDRIDFQEHVDDSNSCSCDDEEISSSCESSDVDWEIHFTPPFVSHQKTTFQKNNNELIQ
ncbi:uncharacterized protein LOC123878544 [Maniola jurtina]|uniref:uncharacterized protein LOC123878544 n=1 Tax=Maniola jurtina TaxID=191418 RepID=UPI001E68E737|nr:uncharacterized protein LOC123878544 [Maniola jurtina]